MSADRPLYLAVAIWGLTIGGAGRRILTLVNGFAARGHAVDLLVLEPTAPLTAELAPAVRLVPMVPPRWLLPFWPRGRRTRIRLAAPLLAAYLRRHRPQVLLSGASHMSLACLLATRLSGSSVPLVLRASSHLSASAGARGGIGARLTRLLLPAAAAVAAVSTAVADDIRRHKRIPPDRNVALPNPTATPDLPLRAAAPLDHPWVAPGAPPLILAVGRLVPEKDFATLLRAFALVRAARPARLVILGEGRERAALERLAAELGLTADLLMPGYDPNPLRWMARAALLVSSSRWEGMPGVIIEALAVGCPVVATDCPGGSAEILGNGVWGRLAPVADPPALAEQMLAAIAEPSPTDLMVRARAFDSEAATLRYLAFLERVARPKRESPHRTQEEA